MKIELLFVSAYYTVALLKFQHNHLVYVVAVQARKLWGGKKRVQHQLRMVELEEFCVLLRTILECFQYLVPPVNWTNTWADISTLGYVGKKFFLTSRKERLKGSPWWLLWVAWYGPFGMKTALQLGMLIPQHPSNWCKFAFQTSQSPGPRTLQQAYALRWDKSWAGSGVPSLIFLATASTFGV